MSVKECRICYEDEKENKLKLIYPCACDGTQKFVHENCLNKWRNTKKKSIEYLECQECKQFYNIGKKYPLEQFKFNLGLPNSCSELTYVMLYNITFIVLAPILNQCDYSYDIPKTMNINDSTILITFLKKNPLLSYSYYYSYKLIYYYSIQDTFETSVLEICNNTLLFYTPF